MYTIEFVCLAVFSIIGSSPVPKLYSLSWRAIHFERCTNQSSSTVWLCPQTRYFNDSGYQPYYSNHKLNQGGKKKKKNTQRNAYADQSQWLARKENDIFSLILANKHRFYLSVKHPKIRWYIIFTMKALQKKYFPWFWLYDLSEHFPY